MKELVVVILVIGAFITGFMGVVVGNHILPEAQWACTTYNYELQSCTQYNRSVK